MKKLLGILVLGLFLSGNANSDIITLKCDGDKDYLTRYAVIDLENKKLGFEKTIPKELDYNITSVSEFEIIAETLFVREYEDGYIYKNADILIINRVTGKVTDDRRIEQINYNPDADYNLGGIPIKVIPDVTCKPFEGEAKF